MGGNQFCILNLKKHITRSKTITHYVRSDALKRARFKGVMCINMSKVIILLAALISGCASTGNITYTGKVEDCSGKEVPNAKIVAFRNGWVPFTLPPSVGSANSISDGTFILNTTKKAHFLSHVNGSVVTINENTKLSINTCKKNT